jgi:hypothetical protein
MKVSHPNTARVPQRFGAHNVPAALCPSSDDVVRDHQPLSRADPTYRNRPTGGPSFGWTTRRVEGPAGLSSSRVILLGASPQDPALATHGLEAANVTAVGASLSSAFEAHPPVVLSGDADPNALLTQLKSATDAGGRCLVMYLTGRLLRTRRNTLVLALTHSAVVDGTVAGLPLSWVTHVLLHAPYRERLLIVDVVTQQGLPALLEEQINKLEVPLWGACTPPPRRLFRRAPVARPVPSPWSGSLAHILGAGLPDAPPYVHAADFSPALAAAALARAPALLHATSPAAGTGPLLRNPGAWRTRLTADQIPAELLATLNSPFLGGA